MYRSKYPKKSKYNKKAGKKSYGKGSKKSFTSKYNTVMAPSTQYYRVPPARTGVGKTGLPAEYAMTFRAASTVAIAPGATVKVYALQPNFAAQPFDTTDMKTQPVGLDQMYTIYKGGIVISGRYRITWVSTTANPTAIACYLSGQTAVASTISNFMAQPGAKYKMTSANGADGATTVIVPFRVANVLGPLDRSEMGSAAVGDAATALTRKLYLHVIVASPSANVTGQLYVEAIQNTLLYDKVNNVDA